MQKKSIQISNQRVATPSKGKENQLFPRFFRRALAGLIVILFVLPARSQDTPPSSYIGINLEWVNDWDVMHPFADAMKQSREAGTIANPADRSAAKDINGWPTEDAAFVVWAGPSKMNGTYKLSFTGQADVTTNIMTMANKVYNSATNTTTADLTLTDAGSTTLNIYFQNTKRTASSATNTGITNVKLMRPGYTTQTFTTPFLNYTDKFAVIRFMDWAYTNGNELSTWSERTLPTHATQNRRNNVTKKEKGVAWEYMIELANTLDKDIWVNIPHRADANYATQLATLLKNNLEADRKIYVEWSNELWNFAPGFGQSGENRTAAINEVNAGSDLNYDGSTNDYYWGYRRVGKKIREISLAFRTVFGNAQMMTRVRPILATQVGDVVFKEQMLYLEATSPQPVNYYIFGAGGTTYFNIPQEHRQRTDLTVDEIVNVLVPQELNGSYRANMIKHANWATAYGVKYLAYEGGTHLSPNGYSDAAKEAANLSEGMGENTKLMWNIFHEVGGYVLCYFQNAGGGTWGATNDYTNLNTPRIRAFDYIRTTARPSINIGTVLPATIKAGRFTMQKGYDTNTDNPVTLTTNKWYNYLVRATSAGSYTIHLTASSLNANGRCQILVDNVSVGTVNIPNTGSNTIFAPTTEVTVNLTAGLHSIRIKNTADTYIVQNVVVEQGTITPPPGNGLEAENATLSGVTVGTTYTGFTGTGYADYTGNTGGYIQWSYNAASAGNYNLDFRYALATGDRPLELRVNGVVVASSLSFPATGAWTTWNAVTRAVALNAGANTIRITAIGSSGANFDNLAVSPVQVVSQTLEAEQASLSGPVVASAYTGYTGTGYVDFANASTDYIQWTYNATSAGAYKLDFRYALPSSSRPLEVRVNGTVVASSLAFPATGSWTTWNLVTQNVNLNAGNNTIRVTAIGSSGANIDHLVVTRTGARMALTGENATEAPALTIFANPVTNGSFEIKSAYNLEGATYTLIDVSGRAVATPSVKSASGYSATLSVARNINGVHFLQVSTHDGKVQVGRVVFQSK